MIHGGAVALAQDRSTTTITLTAGRHSDISWGVVFQSCYWPVCFTGSWWPSSPPVCVQLLKPELRPRPSGSWMIGVIYECHICIRYLRVLHVFSDRWLRPTVGRSGDTGHPVMPRTRVAAASRLHDNVTTQIWSAPGCRCPREARYPRGPEYQQTHSVQESRQANNRWSKRPDRVGIPCLRVMSMKTTPYDSRLPASPRIVLAALPRKLHGSADGCSIVASQTRPSPTLP